MLREPEERGEEERRERDEEQGREAETFIAEVLREAGAGRYLENG
jgi:hypothetical protein